MNERIKELAEQASLYARSDNSSMLFENFQKRYTEKFAELIVRECMAIVFNKSTLETNEDYREGFHRACQFIWQDINKHFGVEE
jgi:hypothetical protein